MNGEQRRIAKAFRRLTGKHPIILKKRGAEGLCWWATVYVLAEAGGGRVVAFSVKNDPRFSEHYAIYLGDGRVFDPTYAQVGGKVCQPLVKLSDYPKNYVAVDVYDWLEDYISSDLEEIQDGIGKILAERTAEERSDRHFFFGCLCFALFAAAVPLAARFLFTVNL